MLFLLRSPCHRFRLRVKRRDRDQTVFESLLPSMCTSYSLSSLSSFSPPFPILFNQYGVSASLYTFPVSLLPSSLSLGRKRKEYSRPNRLLPVSVHPTSPFLSSKTASPSCFSPHRVSLHHRFINWGSTERAGRPSRGRRTCLGGGECCTSSILYLGTV